MSAQEPFDLFEIEVAARTALTPWLVRITFAGENVHLMKTGGPDQRIKLFFPEGNEVSRLAAGPGWYARYKSLADGIRPAIRTYTIRALNAVAGQLDIDFVLHGDTGPATRWAERAKPGDRLQIAAPCAAFAGSAGGYEWRPPLDLQRLLLLADETALPAVAGILEQVSALPKHPQTEVFIEVPASGERIDLAGWPGLDIQWIRRETHSTSLLPVAVRKAWIPASAPLVSANAHADLPEVNVDTSIFWETSNAAGPGFYVWAAGEAAAMLSVRRYLTGERGVPKDCLNVMGYWRAGRVLD